MTTRHFALVFGIVFLLVGIAGFIPGLLAAPAEGDPALAIEAAHGRLMGLFPVNVVHDLIHIAFGIWGIVAYRTLAAARLYAKSVAVIYALLVVMGFIPVLNTTFGLAPIHGHDIWLHALLAIVAAYFGFFRSDSEPALAMR